MKKLFLFAFIIALAGVVINYSLGGFKPITPGLISTEKVIVYGKPYEGHYNSETLDELVKEFRAVLSDTEVPGLLTIINYHQPELEKRGTVKQFVGIVWQAKSTGFNYDSLVVESYNGAQFRIPVRPLVMPSPQKLKGLANELAQQMNTTLKGISIEQYQDKTLIINFPFDTSN